MTHDLPSRRDGSAVNATTLASAGLHTPTTLEIIVGVPLTLSPLAVDPRVQLVSEALTKFHQGEQSLEQSAASRPVAQLKILRSVLRIPILESLGHF